MLKLVMLAQIGGLKLITLKIWDKLSGGDNALWYWQEILESTEPEEYPRLLGHIYRYYTGDELNLDHPVSYNEKIQWLKLFDSGAVKTELTDKYRVREWIKEKIGDSYLVPLLGVWDSFDDIDFDLLPDAFVLKCNHGCMMNLVVENKKDLDIAGARELFNVWMKRNYAFWSLELQYRDIPRKIIAEAYMAQADGELLDYKIHVFHGVPRIIKVIGRRDLQEHTARECVLTPDWVPQELSYHTYDSYDTVPERPENLDEMLSIAGKLGEGFRYVRVDLYDLDGQIKFGEMSFTPASGFGKWSGDEQYLVGSWIDLS